MAHPSDSEAGIVAIAQSHHLEHKSILRDGIIGFADGLTVPFALTAGLSSLGSSKLVVIAGLAELVSGSISMGLGAYLGTASDVQRYNVAEQRKRKDMVTSPGKEEEKVYSFLCAYGATRDDVAPFVTALRRSKEDCLRFILQCDMDLDKPGRGDAYISAVTMGVAYFVGGLLPLIPYFAIRQVRTALFVSIGLTAAILLLFGYVKSLFSGVNGRQSIISAVQTLGIGAAAAAASYGIVRAVDTGHIS